jgi:uncharacterized membrane protein
MMWPYYGDGWSWLWMTGMMVVFWGALIVLAILGFRAIGGSGNTDGDAMSALRKRLAAGEITQEEFEKTERLLQG